MMEETTGNSQKTKIAMRACVIGAMVCTLIVMCAAFFLLWYSTSPADFTPTTVHIEKNTSVKSAAEKLAYEHVIRSPFLFRLGSIILRDKKGVIAGDYFFAKPESVWTVAERLVYGQQGLIPVKVTFPEGITVAEMADILGRSSLNKQTFSSSTFLTLATTTDAEGYFFPDTYLFPPNSTTQSVIGALRDNFQNQISSEPLARDIVAFGRPQKDVVIMASLLEKEASTEIDRQIIAGILWKRVDKGMLLEVDPTLTYVTGRTSAHLTVADLAMDSPYNTYRYKGLPPHPIDNPGLDALTAAVTPTSTPYWFYLAGNDNVVHYATTYDEQLANEKKYLGE